VVVGRDGAGVAGVADVVVGKTTGTEPLAAMVEPVFLTLASKVIDLFTRAGSRSPVTGFVTVTPSAGAEPSAVGCVSLNVAVG